MSGVNNFSLSFDPQQFQAVIASVAATPAEVNKASARAARHTMSILKTQIARLVASETGVPVGKLKTRVTIKRENGTQNMGLFVGLNAMPYDKAGPVSQSKAGLKSRAGIVKGGFDNQVYGNGRGWIRRKRARALGLNHLPGVFKGSDKGKLPNYPVLRISHDLSGSANAVIMEFQKQAKAKFIARFEHDLKHIKGLL